MSLKTMPSPKLTEQDLFLFNEGSHFHLFNKLGAQISDDGCTFSVWAPNAKFVSVIGDFNDWDKSAHPLSAQGSSGIWSVLVEGVEQGQRYKFHIESQVNGYVVDKADPFAFTAEIPPQTCSRVWDLNYHWSDQAWMNSRRDKNALKSPVSIYELHLGSWMRVPEEMNRPLTYTELAPKLAAYVKQMGFTHVELMPVMEHPFHGSWGYQVTGYFAPSSRYGTPQDFMFLVDHLHQNGIGVILDWVPSHFPNDEHGLSFFDGTCLYEHADQRQGYHPDWKTSIFNYGRNEVRSFLISNAIFWMDVYHVDGLRVDGVASMLYLDYSRKEGEWVPNEHGGRENTAAISFLKRMNEEVYRDRPGVQTYAEESTAWAMVTRPTFAGGLGFGFKWDMGWMHDILRYMSKDPVFRKHHQNDLTFRMLYAFTENFVLSLSHDEVVHGKGSLLAKMSGDDWQKFANLRLLYGMMFAMAGKKLLFMGDEFGQGREWDHDGSLDWHLLNYPQHQGVKRLVQDLNRLYKNEPALYEQDCEPAGFEWVDCNDSEQSTLFFLRQGGGSSILAALNFTPQPRHNYRVGVPGGSFWREILNTDAGIYGGSGVGNQGGIKSESIPWHNRPNSLNLILPPLGALFLKREG